ncbi:MAG: RluA family pseudouridine synthase [Oligoflexia bacterium]|nr:RluA family pseudouridine synthase [Oligoflexia bacterium]
MDSANYLDSSNFSNTEDIEIVISKEDQKDFKRLDHLLTAKLPFRRSFIKKMFEQQLITSEQIDLSLSKIPAVDTIINIEIPPPVPLNAEAENIPLEVLYEDEDIIFINKPAGIVTHPAPGNYTGTLVNALLYHCPDLKGIGGVKRPGIVHRLDKGTSGVMIISKSNEAHEKLVLLFSQHKINRIYEAITMPLSVNSSASTNRNMQIKHGTIKSMIGRHPSNRIKMAINPKNDHGKVAITNYKILNEMQDNLYHFELKLETGRTHQIRVHLSSILKTPILMDPLYANPKEQLKQISNEEIKELICDYPHPFLHARTLGLNHPITGKYLEFSVSHPETFSKLLFLANKKKE